MTNNTKIALITGGNAGIGKATAEGIAQAGYITIIVSRNVEKGKLACQDIINKTGNPNVELLIADLSNQDSIRQLAKQFKAKYNHLDLLVNNAASFYDTLQYTSNHIEMQWATNHLAYFLLTNLLLPELKNSPSARIINVSSNGHYRANINFDDLNNEKNYNGLKAYGQSKLANVLFTYELAQQLAGTRITANALHPGVVKTDIGSKFATGFIGKVWNLLMKLPLSIPTNEGAKTSLYLALSPEVEGVTAKYFNKCKPQPSSKISYNEALAKKLWEHSLKQTNL